MIEALLPAVVLAKLRHYRIRPVFLAWFCYPALVLQGVLIFLQVTPFTGNYFFVQFASAFKIAEILSFLFPMFALQLYKPAFIGCGSILFGTLLNRFAIVENGGKMPVFPTFSYLTGYVKSDTFSLVQGIHVLGGDATRWKFLTDYIDLGYSILSPGDLFIHFFTFLMFYYMIKSINLRFESESIMTEG